MSQKRMGRPPMPKGKASTALIGVRVSHEERAVIEERARKEELTVSKWARAKLLKAAGLKTKT